MPKAQTIEDIISVVGTTLAVAGIIASIFLWPQAVLQVVHALIGILILAFIAWVIAWLGSSGR